MEKNRLLIEQVTKKILEADPRYINYIGEKPWYERLLSNFKYAVFAGLLVGVGAGVGLSTVFTTSAEKSLERQIVYGKVVVETTTTPEAIIALRKEFPSINFEELNTKRDVAKEFVGKNNFIALASEMEGFRGDLHKDPGTGLNIGFGYNVTKRLGDSKIEVIEDLKSIGLKDDVIDKIIKIASTPQKDLNLAIKNFNKNFNKEIINIEQGVALLKRTEPEYRRFAKIVFSDSFNKMKKNQQEVLTYAAYKVGFTSLSQYHNAIEKASELYAKEKNPTKESLRAIAKELTFFYNKNGGQKVLDEKASLIAHTFMHQDYLAVEVKAFDKVKNSMNKLMSNKINFNDELSENLKSVRDSLRKNNKEDRSFMEAFGIKKV